MNDDITYVVHETSTGHRVIHMEVPEDVVVFINGKDCSPENLEHWVKFGLSKRSGDLEILEDFHDRLDRFLDSGRVLY